MKHQGKLREVLQPVRVRKVRWFRANLLDLLALGSWEPTVTLIILQSNLTNIDQIQKNYGVLVVFGIITGYASILECK